MDAFTNDDIKGYLIHSGRMTVDSLQKDLKNANNAVKNRNDGSQIDALISMKKAEDCIQNLKNEFNKEIQEKNREIQNLKERLNQTDF